MTDQLKEADILLIDEQYNKAIELFDQININDLDEDKKAYYFGHRAITLFKLNKKSEALISLKKALDIDKDNERWINKLKEWTTLPYDWYQTSDHVVITVANEQIQNVNIKTLSDNQHVIIEFISPNTSQLELNLLHPINKDASSFTILTKKVNVKLKKQNENVQWSSLTSEKSVRTNTKRDWDSIVGQLDVNESEDDVNDFFKRIYSSSSDDVKKAMMKSYQESGGTVLSTNWDEVSKANVKMQPPEGMEFKKWDS